MAYSISTFTAYFKTFMGKIKEDKSVDHFHASLYTLKQLFILYVRQDGFWLWSVLAFSNAPGTEGMGVRVNQSMKGSLHYNFPDWGKKT